MKRARQDAGDAADKEMDRVIRRTSRAHREARPHGACLDAETLAGLADRTLAAHERASAEAHAADCDRCLSVLATIVRTTPPPSVQQRLGWLSIRWLVPLTAAAASITAWAIVQQPTSSPRPAAPAVSMIDAPKPAEPTSPVERDSPPAPLADALEKKQEKSRTSADAVAGDALASKRADTAAGASAPANAAHRAPPPAAGAPPAAPQAAAREERRQFSARDAAAGPLTIPSPDPDVRWRIAAQSVERSIDGGRTWRAQPTGTSTDLLAGSSPDGTVCWIVGREGVVLLSTDGESWRRLEAPDKNVDLIAVIARDGTVATVTAADGRTYRTIDAGRTWTLQENPAAPF